MTQTERLLYLIQYLLNENRELQPLEIPVKDMERKRLLHIPEKRFRVCVLSRNTP